MLCVHQSMWCCRCTVSGCTGSSSWNGQVIGVLSVCCLNSSELLLSFLAPRATSMHSTTDEDHFKSTDT